MLYALFLVSLFLTMFFSFGFGTEVEGKGRGADFGFWGALVFASLTAVIAWHF